MKMPSPTCAFHNDSIPQILGVTSNDRQAICTVQLPCNEHECCKIKRVECLAVAQNHECHPPDHPVLDVPNVSEQGRGPGGSTELCPHLPSDALHAALRPPLLQGMAFHQAAPAWWPLGPGQHSGSSLFMVCACPVQGSNPAAAEDD